MAPCRRRTVPSRASAPNGSGSPSASRRARGLAGAFACGGLGALSFTFSALASDVVVAAPGGDLAAKPLARLGQPPRDSPFLPAQVPRRLGLAVTFEAAQDERRPQLLGQKSHLVVEDCLRLAERELGDGTGWDRGRGWQSERL